MGNCLEIKGLCTCAVPPPVFWMETVMNVEAALCHLLVRRFPAF